MIQTELKIMQSIKHPNIVQCYGHYDEPDHYCIRMQLCNRGDLNNYLLKKQLHEDEAYDLLLQAIRGMMALHAKQIIHRDIKPANLFIHYENDKVKLLIGDFGFSKEVINKTKTQVGTPILMAPEVLTGDKGYDSRIDIWSLGFTFFYMLYKQYPYSPLNYMDLLDLIKVKTAENLPFPSQPHVSSEKKDLLRRMIQVDVNKRITWEQLFSILPENRSILVQTDQIEDGSICLCLQIDHSLDEQTDFDLKQSLS